MTIEELYEKKTALLENLTRENGMSAAGLERLAEVLKCEPDINAVYRALGNLKKPEAPRALADQAPRSRRTQKESDTSATEVPEE